LHCAYAHNGTKKTHNNNLTPCKPAPKTKQKINSRNEQKQHQKSINNTKQQTQSSIIIIAIVQYANRDTTTTKSCFYRGSTPGTLPAIKTNNKSAQIIKITAYRN